MNQHVSNFTKGIVKTLVHGTVTGLGMQIGHAAYGQLKEVYPRLKSDVYPAVRDKLQSLRARFSQTQVENTESKTETPADNKSTN